MRTRIALAAIAAVSVFSANALASTVGFQFRLMTSNTSVQSNVAGGYTYQPFNPGNTQSASANTPVLQLLNTSTAAGFVLTSFNFTIPAASGRVFDLVVGETTRGGNGFTFTEVLPDTTNNNGNPGGPNSRTIEYNFVGFNAAESFIAQADLDPGTLTNAQFLQAVSGGTLTATFSNGVRTETLSAQYGNLTSASNGIYSLNGAAVVPLPPAALGGLALIGAIGGVRKLRQRRNAAI